MNLLQPNVLKCIYIYLGKYSFDRSCSSQSFCVDLICLFNFQSSKNCSVQVDCSRSTNSLFNRESAVHIIKLTPQSLKVSKELLTIICM